MGCHGDNKGSNGSNHKHNHIKHMLHMVVCCGLPILIVGMLPIISKLNPSAGSTVAKIVPFMSNNDVSYAANDV